jgi:phage shock protein PspC (stress-responsive transcriptional regulator)
MKKVMSVNLGGLVFPIDNEAYSRLEGYIEALEKQFQHTEGREEIIADIESRIAEIFQEKVKSGRESIHSTDVEEIISIMGAPRDLMGEEPEPAAAPRPKAARPEAPRAQESAETEAGPRRFFRNADDKLLGGVCSGFAAYINADPLVVRLAFLLAVLGFGVGPVLYLILWIIVPEAKTTSEKLQMKGKKVTVDSIEKAIRNEANDLQRRFENMKEEIDRNPDHPLNKAEKRGRDFFAEAGNSVGKMAGGIAKLLMVALAAVMLVAVLAAIFGVTGGLGFATFMIPAMPGLLFSSAAQFNVLMVGLLAVLCIPLLIIAYKTFRFVLGIRVGTRALDGLFLVAWIVGLGLVLVVGARVASEFQREVSLREEVPLQTQPQRTIYLNKLDPPARSFRQNDKVHIDNVALTDDSIFFQQVRLDIEPGKEDRFVLYALKRARGKDRDQAKNNANNISYVFRELDSVLALSNEYTLTKGSWRAQHLDLLVEVPVGRRVVLDERLRPMLRNVSMKTHLPDDELYNRMLVMSEEGLEPLVRGKQ